MFFQRLIKKIFKPSVVKVLVFNVQNLFLFIDDGSIPNLSELDEQKWKDLSHSLNRNKKLKDLYEIARVIEELDPDIVFMVEVGGVQSLRYFTTLFLKNRYKDMMIEGNSDRGIDFGYLIKNDFSYQCSIHSSKNSTIAKNEYFSRDCLELKVMDGKKVVLSTLGVHLKSKLDFRKKDYEGRRKRQKEVRALVRIFEKRKKWYGPDTPVMLLGDFNGVASTKYYEPEFSPIYQKTSLKDYLEIMNVPLDERFTHVYFAKGNRVQRQQLDYIFIEDKYGESIDENLSGVYRYPDQFGVDYTIDSIKEKVALPSDHFPVYMTLKLK
ncbi:MAG: hypothetical protein HOE90_15425 [Bacteriovoracaceae bacterium]|nr:hypothetical protein [Bacteriovoracaceae bacterium]